MIIKEITIKNFRCFREQTLRCDNLTAFLGQNGGGKSTILKALDYFYDVKAPINESDFYSQDTDRTIEIRLVYGELGDQEKGDFSAYINNDQLAVTKRIYLEENQIQQKYFAATKQIPQLAAIRELRGVTEKRNHWNNLADSQELPEFGPRSVRGDNPDQLSSNYEEQHPELTEWIEREAQFFGPRNIGGGIIDKYTKFVYVPAVRDVMDDMAEKRGAAMYQLLDMIVMRRFQTRPDVVKLQQDFEERIREVYHPDNLTEFATLAQDISRTLQLFVPNAALGLTSSEPSLPNLPTPLTIATLTEDEFEGPIDRKGHGLQRALIFSLLQHLAVAEPVEVSESTSEDQDSESEQNETEIAAGYRGPDLIIAIEEPELYQHPLRARHLSNVLLKMSQEKDIGLGGRNQVIYTTHSPHFVDLGRFSSLRIVRKCKADDGLAPYATISQFTLTGAAQEMARVTERPQKEFTAESFRARAYPVMTTLVSEGFFANAVVIVEGLTEVAALTAISEIKNANWLSKGVAVISANGKSKIDRSTVIFRGFGIPTYFVFDGDNRYAAHQRCSEEAKYNRILLRLANADMCDFPETTVGENYACFEDEFETYCKGVISEKIYSDLLEQIAHQHGYSKPSEGSKNYEVVVELISEIYNQGHTLPVLEQIVDRVNQLT